MATSKFKFGPQPALDQAIVARQSCEEALVHARRMLEADELKLQKLIAVVEKTRQQIRAEHDKLVSRQGQTSDPRELSQNGRFLDALRVKEQAQQGAVDKQREQVAFARDRVELRKRELTEAVAQVQALEKLKEKRRREHDVFVEKADEKRRDDDSIQLWNNRPD